MRVLARRTANGMVPADEEALSAFHSWPVGTVAYVEIKGARNPRQHRLLFALLKTMVEHAEFVSTEGALYALKMATGHVKKIIVRGDEVHMEPASISYANMSQSDFSEWFDGAIHVICDRWLPGWKDDDLKKHILEMTGG